MLKAKEIGDKVETTFERYEDQLMKLSVGDMLKPFAKQAVSGEYEKLSQDLEHLVPVADAYLGLLDTLSQSFDRETSVKESSFNKHETLTKEIEVMTNQLTECDANENEANEKLRQFKAPIEKLKNEMDTLQDLVNQKLLDRCKKYFAAWTDDHACFITESLVGVLKGVERADSRAVELYMRKEEGMRMALNRIKYAEMPLERTKALIDDLTKTRAQQMGMVDASGNPTSVDFPKHIMDFKVFYQILVNICQRSIAEHDAAKFEKIVEESKKLRVQNAKTIASHNKRLELIKQVSAMEPWQRTSDKVWKQSAKVAKELTKAEKDLAAVVLSKVPNAHKKPNLFKDYVVKDLASTELPGPTTAFEFAPIPSSLE